MGRLINAFAPTGRGPVGGDLDETALEAALSALHARGRAAHPALALTDEAFVAHLGRCGVTPEAAHDVFIEDLYLACACLRDVPGAVARLQELHGPRVAREIRRVGKAGGFHDEAEQRLWDTLLVGAGSGPRLATYVGVGRLDRWLGISAQRVALMIVRHEDAEGRARDEVAAHERMISPDPELEAIKDRYRDSFQRAIQGALEDLEVRERMIFRMHLVEGLTLEQIGKVYAVHQTTITRWLADARALVLAGAKRRLRDELQLDPEEFDSLVRLLVSQLDLNLTQALGP